MDSGLDHQTIWQLSSILDPAGYSFVCCMKETEVAGDIMVAKQFPEVCLSVQSKAFLYLASDRWGVDKMTVT